MLCRAVQVIPMPGCHPAGQHSARFLSFPTMISLDCSGIASKSKVSSCSLWPMPLRHQYTYVCIPRLRYNEKLTGALWPCSTESESSEDTSSGMPSKCTTGLSDAPLPYDISKRAIRERHELWLATVLQMSEMIVSLADTLKKPSTNLKCRQHCKFESTCASTEQGA